MHADSRSDRGFILATTLLVMTLLTVMLTAAFVTISAEYRTTNASYASTRSLTIAQAGLQQYLSQSHPLAGSTFDSTSYTYSGGYAAVAARRLRDSTATSRAVWIVVSTGADTTGKTSLGYRYKSTGNRVVAQMAWLDAGVLPARAAMVAANGIQLTGHGNNPVSGVNAGSATGGCTPPYGAAKDTFGITVPTGAFNLGGDYPGGEGVNGLDVLNSGAAVIDSTRIDWAKVLAGEFTPDYVNTFPPLYPSAYQSTYFSDDVTIPGRRYNGLLVVAGDVTLSDGTHWDGVIIAGGRLDAGANGNFTIHGMIITGLNGGSQKNRVRRDNGSNQIIIRWDYCYTRASTASLSYLSPIRGSFVDTWRTY